MNYRMMTLGQKTLTALKSEMRVEVTEVFDTFEDTRERIRDKK